MGSIYNYFDSKAALVCATVESVWCEIFHRPENSAVFRVKNILPAKRGFYGKTWDIETESCRHFLKIDYWSHHKKELQDNLPIIQYMTDSGISGIGYTLQQGRLCYYCYDFFFHYLNEYLKSIADSESQGRKEEIVKDLIGYLTDCWIYERLETAHSVR